jgi:hypothetical protein
MRAAFVAVCAAALICSAAAAQTPIACNEWIRGTPGLFRFDGIGGQYVQAIVYPSLRAGLDVALLPEPGDAPPPPLITGGEGGAVGFVLPSSGPRRLAVSGVGDFVLALTCRPASYDALHECVDQTILCGQTAEWVLTPQSCKFDDVPFREYEAFAFSGSAGEVVTADAQSDDFEPRIGIYQAKAGGPLGASQSISPATDRLAFTLPYTGSYLIVVTSRRDSGTRTGRFALTVHECGSPSCLPPLFTDEPADVVVPYGARATLTATAIGSAAVRYVWSDRSSLPAPIAEGQRFTTPRVTAPQFYAVAAVTPCGTTDSRVVAVKPLADHRRPARQVVCVKFCKKGEAAVGSLSIG